MRVFITDALAIDLESEQWICTGCDAGLGSARENYKKGLRVRPRDPREIHAPIIDPDRYEFTFAPDPDWVRIVEYYCPHCARQIEAEYLPPGHPPAHDIDFDLDALKAQWADREPLAEPALGPEFVAPPHHHKKGGG
ncbi:MAG: acetone carboxylase subunit gamma [Parasphingopyxis sp.]|uniref:acetone carboxylase subunit gamma n=1 Tax=Parasphingopyxis sp. TaxID=1920299 RepID=UPI003FA147A3